MQPAYSCVFDVVQPDPFSQLPKLSKFGTRARPGRHLFPSTAVTLGLLGIETHHVPLPVEFEFFVWFVPLEHVVDDYKYCVRYRQGSATRPRLTAIR